MFDDEYDKEEREVDWTDDALGNFCIGDYATVDKGSCNQVQIEIIEIGEEMVLVQDQHGSTYPVNILRLSK